MIQITEAAAEEIARQRDKRGTPDARDPRRHPRRRLHGLLLRLRVGRRGAARDRQGVRAARRARSSSTRRACLPERHRARLRERHDGSRVQVQQPERQGRAAAAASRSSSELRRSTAIASDYFELLGLPRRFALDPAELERSYLERSRALHPDRSRARRRPSASRALAQAMALNEAYRTLKRDRAAAPSTCSRSQGVTIGDNERVEPGAPDGGPGAARGARRGARRRRPRRAAPARAATRAARARASWRARAAVRRARGRRRAPSGRRGSTPWSTQADPCCATSTATSRTCDATLDEERRP